jgi:hypothetical protein
MIFLIDDSCHIAAASTVILCDTELAVAKANALSLGPKVEVWQESRRRADRGYLKEPRRPTRRPIQEGQRAGRGRRFETRKVTTRAEYAAR